MKEQLKTKGNNMSDTTDRPTTFSANLRTRTIIVHIDDYSKMVIRLPKGCRPDQCKITYSKDCKANVLQPRIFDIEDHLVDKKTGKTLSQIRKTG